LEIFSLPVIDIPGFGAVQADNFASEQTLNRLVDAVNNMNQGTGGVQSIFAAVAGDSKRAARDLKQLGAAADRTKDSMEGQSSAAEALTKRNMQASNSFASFSRKMSSVSFESPITAFRAGLEKITDAVGENAGKITAGFTAVGTLIGGLPGAAAGLALGTLVTASSAVAGVLGGVLLGDLEKMSTEFGKAQQSGALFGNSMLNFRNIASNSGLTMAQFSNVITKNSEAMSAFGGTTTQGAQEFARANSLLIRNHGQELRRIGVSYEEMGMRTADFIATLVESGVPIYENGVATEDVVRRTKELAVQQKTLAAINGTTIDQEKEKQRMQRKDAQMNAVLMGLNEKEREVVQQLSAQFPQATQFIKEFVAFGGPVTKEGNLQAAMMSTLTSEIGNTITAVKNGQSVPGALGTLENLAASSPQIAAETKVMADMVKLSIAGSTNTVVQMAEKNFNAQFELMNKTQAGVVTNVLQSLTPGLDRFKNAADTASETVYGLNKAFQTGKISLSQIAEAVYRSGPGGAALKTVANTAAGVGNVAQRAAAELKMDTSKTQAVGPSVDITRQGFAPMSEGGIVDSIVGLLPDMIANPMKEAMTGLGELVKQGNTANVAAIDNLTVEVKKLTTSNKNLVDATKTHGTG
jgi:hypothetical protein